MDYNKFRMFGCPLYTHIPSDDSSKNDPKAHRCIFLNFGEEVKGFKLCDPVTKKVLFSRDVTFDEINQSNDDAIEVELKDEESKKISGEVEQPQEVELGPSIAHDRPRRTIKTPFKFGWKDEVNYALIISEGDLTSYKETINVEDKESWMGIIVEKMEALRTNSVWNLVPRPKG